jgi:hypothetical protein
MMPAYLRAAAAVALYQTQLQVLEHLSSLPAPSCELYEQGAAALLIQLGVMTTKDPYMLLRRAVDEIALEGPQGCTLARLWQLLDLKDVYLQRWVWKCLFQDAGFEVDVSKVAGADDGEPLAANLADITDQSTVKLIAHESVRHRALGVPAGHDLSELDMQMLTMVGRCREEGMTLKAAAKAFLGQELGSTHRGDKRKEKPLYHVMDRLLERNVLVRRFCLEEVRNLYFQMQFSAIICSQLSCMHEAMPFQATCSSKHPLMLKY